MTITVTDVFCGACGSSSGAIEAGAELRLGLNHWERAIETGSTNFPEADFDRQDVSSLTTERIRRYPDSDLLLASPECFPAGTLILSGRGLVPIERVEIGDRVLTHLGRWKRVSNTTKARKPTVVLSGQGHPGLETTAEHPFWAREQARRWDNEKRDYDRRVLSDASWVPAKMLLDGKHRWATPVRYPTALWVPDVPGRGMTMDLDELWWMVGRWLGDGVVRFREDQGGEVTIVAGKHEADELERRLSVFAPVGDCKAGRGELRWRRREIRTAVLFECGHTGLVRWLTNHFGRYSHGKTVPAWALGMQEGHRIALLAGYLSADGSFTKRKTMAATVSKRLAVGMRLLAESLGYRAGLYRYKQHADTIEGRKVNVRDQWVIAWENNRSSREAVADQGHAWSLIKKIRPGREEVEVYNLSVEDDESYVADGIVVHNCTNHSLAKGARRRKPQGPSLFEDGPAADDEQDRSRATMWDVCRFAEQKLLKGRPYKAIIVENVVDAYRWGYKDDGGLFAAWLMAMKALGYEHEIVWLNSMFCPPTPQSRDRMYVVFWRKGMRAPNLRVEPVCWCPGCERAVDGRQTWKRADRQWGKYNHQYFYTCPECYRTVLPGAFPAASIIDDTLPAPLIGERTRPLAPNTRERIRRGLERLASEPFAIRLTHGKAPRPLTLPLVALTTRHDMAMVLPVAGNTYERTPGNRARNAGHDPLPTLNGTRESALVMLTRTAHRGANGAYARNGDSDPGFTVTQAQDLALVMANTQHGVPRPAGREPSQTLRMEGGLSLVYANRANGLARPAAEHPSQAVCTGRHLAVIVANYGPGPGGWARRAGELPLGSVTTRDGHSLLVPYRRTGNAVVAGRETAATIDTRDRFALVVPDDDPADAVEIEAPGQPRPVTDEEIDACRFRMLALPEVAGAMGMLHHPRGGPYIVVGNQREQMKQYGNGVTPKSMRLLVGRVQPILDEETAS